MLFFLFLTRLCDSVCLCLTTLNFYENSNQSALACYFIYISTDTPMFRACSLTSTIFSTRLTITIYPIMILILCHFSRLSNAAQYVLESLQYEVRFVKQELCVTLRPSTHYHKIRYNMFVYIFMYNLIGIYNLYISNIDVCMHMLTFCCVL